MAQPAPTAASVSLYIQRGCAVCHQVRRFLETNQIDFEIRWLSDPANVAALDGISERFGIRGFPVLVIGDTVTTSPKPDDITASLEAGGHALRPDGTSEGAASTDRAGVPASAIWVANLGAGSLSFVDPTTFTAAGETLPMGVGAMPCGIAWDPATDVVAVSDFALHRVTFFNRATGAYLRDDLASSTVPMPEQPGDIVTDLRRHRFYVSCAGQPSLVALDSTDGSYVGGALGSAVLPLPSADRPDRGPRPS